GARGAALLHPADHRGAVQHGPAVGTELRLSAQLRLLVWGARRSRIVAQLSQADRPGRSRMSSAAGQRGEQVIDRTFLNRDPIAVRSVELREPLRALTDVTGYAGVRVYVMLDDCPLGFVEIANNYQPVGAEHLRAAIAAQLP